jgi:hypothetical protein
MWCCHILDWPTYSTYRHAFARCVVLEGMCQGIMQGMFLLKSYMELFKEVAYCILHYQSAGIYAVIVVARHCLKFFGLFHIKEYCHSSSTVI